MFFEDLALCRYHRGTLDADSWHAPLLAVGWLERPHRYMQGVAPGDLGSRLDRFVHAALEAFPHEQFRGLHHCSLCPSEATAAPLPLSHINLLIPGKETIYAAPAGIVHYIAEHAYLPPKAFIEAVSECPEYASPAYLLALRQANGGHGIPMKTREESLAETRKAVLHRKESLDRVVGLLRQLGIGLEPLAAAPWVPGVERRFKRQLPPLYRSLVSAFSFLACEVGEVGLFGNLGVEDPDDLSVAPFADPHLSGWLIAHGFVQFGRPATGSYDPVCFDYSAALRRREPGIVTLDHEDILLERKKVHKRLVAEDLLSLIETAGQI